MTMSMVVVVVIFGPFPSRVSELVLVAKNGSRWLRHATVTDATRTSGWAEGKGRRQLRAQEKNISHDDIWMNALQLRGEMELSGGGRRIRVRNLHCTDFFLLLSETMHSTSSSLQLVQGAPCSVTLHRTFRARQHWHAFEALLFTERPDGCPSIPAWAALRFGGCWDSRWSDGEAE